jgi:CTP:molybdopterin cytidylyltransferase MocA
MISSILLAGGLSTRMGSPKALSDWHGEPLICYQVRQLKEAGVDEVVVVLGHRADEIQRQMRRLPCRVMFNARYQMGRAGSLRIGAKAVNRDAEAIVILSVDQPRPASLIRELLANHAVGGPITRPEYDGRHGHPVIVPGTLREELMQAEDDDEGLRGVLDAHRADIVNVPCGAACLVDVNTPADLEAALREIPVEA